MFQSFRKNHTHVKKLGAHLTISVRHLLMNLKTNYLLKNVLKWAKCTINHNHMRYGSWDTEKDKFFCHFGPFFALLSPPNNPENRNSEKNKEASGGVIILDICVPKITIIWCMLPGLFFAFYPTNNPRNQNFEKMKKRSGDIIILHKHPINDNHMMYGFWDMKRDKQIFVILGYLLLRPLPHPLTAQNSSKKQN